MIELFGRIREAAGRWREAFALYDKFARQSSWPGLRYRAALSGIIAGAQDRVGPASAALLVDEALARTLSSFTSEIDQAEVARCTSFVNACCCGTPSTTGLFAMSSASSIFGAAGTPRPTHT